MTPRAAYGRRIARAMIRRQGQLITFRRVTRLAGPDPAANPPRVRNLVVDGQHDADATTLRLRGAAIVGRFLPGDAVSVGGVTFLCAGQAVAAANRVDIPLSQPIGLSVTPPGLSLRLRTQDDLILTTMAGDTLTARREGVLADGAAVAGYAWAADRGVRAVVSAYPQGLVDGQMILPTDAQVRLAAMDFPFDPQPQDLVLIDLSEGRRVRLLSVVNVAAQSEMGTPVMFTLQGRAT